MLHENFEKWVMLSIHKFVSDNITDIPIYIEGQKRKTANLPEFIELRVDGPAIEELSKNYFEVKLDINVLIQCVQSDEYLRIYEICGKVRSVLDSIIPIYRLGDTGTLIGCLNVYTKSARTKDPIEVHHYGIIDVKVGLLQSSVDVEFFMQIKGD